MRAPMANCCALVTEMSVPYYLHTQQLLQRQTNRHAYLYPMLPASFPTRDGAYVWAGIAPRPAELRIIVEFLADMGAAEDLIADARFADPDFLALFETRMLIVERVAAYIAQHTADDVYRAAQDHKLAWGAVWPPEANLDNPNWQERGVFTYLTHADEPNLPPLPYATAPWIAPASPWRVTHPAPHLGQHNAEVYGTLGVTPDELEMLSRHGIL